MYSSPEEVTDFKEQLLRGVKSASSGFNPTGANGEKTPARRPMLVLDLDGNVVIGFNRLKKDRLAGEVENPKNQSIPFNSDIASLTASGDIEPTLFAAKAMDVRLPKDLAETIKRLQKENHPFDIAILTSRGMADAKKIMEASGIESLYHLTFAADSGATAYINGKFIKVHETTEEEISFTDSVAILEEELNAKAQEIAGHINESIFIEPKTPGLAINVHYRGILDELGLDDQSRAAKDLELRSALSEILNRHIESHSPRDEDKPRYSLLIGPETLEVKHPIVDKGVGLKYIVDQALKAGVKPSAILYAGDDVTKTNLKTGFTVPGTDYYAFQAGRDIQEETNIPFGTIHTLHPADKSLIDADLDASANGIAPDESRIIRPITGAEDDRVKADVTTASPLQTGKLVKDIFAAVEQKLTPSRDNGGRVL